FKKKKTKQNKTKQNETKKNKYNIQHNTQRKKKNYQFPNYQSNFSHRTRIFVADDRHQVEGEEHKGTCSEIGRPGADKRGGEKDLGPAADRGRRLQVGRPEYADCVAELRRGRSDVSQKGFYYSFHFIFIFIFISFSFSFSFFSFSFSFHFIF